MWHASPCLDSSGGIAAGSRLWPDKQPLSRHTSINNSLSYIKPAVRCHSQPQYKSNQPSTCMSVCTHHVPSLHPSWWYMCTLTDSCTLTQTQIHPYRQKYTIGMRVDLVCCLCRPVLCSPGWKAGEQWRAVVMLSNPCSAATRSQRMLGMPVSSCTSLDCVDHSTCALTLRLVKVV